jgi:hypothetical protein
VCQIITFYCSNLKAIFATLNLTKLIMKLAILYTAYRQFDELDFAAEFLEQSRNIKNSDLIYHCNNGEIKKETLAQKLEKLPCNNLYFIYNPKSNSGGYAYGQFEAICDAWDIIQRGEYDWIIHIHPDVFVVDEKLLLSALYQADKDGKSLVVTKNLGYNYPAFSTDFFAFRPKVIPKSVFESYKYLIPDGIPLSSNPSCSTFPLECAFFFEIYRHKVSFHLANRFISGDYHRDIDCLGLWHEHNHKRVKRYFDHPSKRWSETIIRVFNRPRYSFSFVREWLWRTKNKLPRDPLAKMLTKV